MATCTEHPDAEARATCTACGRLLCSGCLELALEGTDQHCAHCHAIAKPVPREVVAAAPVVRAPLPTASIAGTGAVIASPDDSVVTKVLRYALARETLLTLVGLTVFTTALRWLGGYGLGFSGLVLIIVAGGLEISYYFRVLTSVSHGDAHFETPDFSSFGEDVFNPLLRYLATYIPLVVSVAWLGSDTTGHWLDGLALVVARPGAIFDHSGPALVFCAWLALWPLMTIIAAIGRSVIATYNPATWFQTLSTLGARYVVGALAFYALLAAEDYAIPQLASSGIASITFIGVLVIALAANFAMVLRGCVLGMVCEPYNQ